MNIKTYIHFLRNALKIKLNSTHRVPLTMNIQLTGLCNTNCLYCAQDHTDNRELSLKVLQDVFNEAWESGCRRINLTGGEPLLHNDLIEIVKSAKKKGFFISLATSGVNAMEQFEALKYIDRVMLSFDGPREVRERLSGSKAAAYSEEAVSLFKKNNIPFWTTTVLTKINLNCIDWIIDYAQKNDSVANFVLLQTGPGKTIFDQPTVNQVADIIPSNKELKNVIDHLINLKKKGMPVGSSMPYLELLRDWPDYLSSCSPKRSRHYKCLAWQNTCELLHDGNLYSCVSALNCPPGIYIYKHGFRSSFRLLPKIEACSSCIVPCQLESNLIFNLKYRTVLNWLKHI